jgi:hypothetical protein
MSYSLSRADRLTHLKIVVLSLVAGIGVAFGAVSMRLADPGTASRVFPSQPQPREEQVVTVVSDDIPCRKQVWPNIDRKCLKWTTTASATPAATDVNTGTVTAAPESTAQVVTPAQHEAQLAAAELLPAQAAKQADAERAERKARIAARAKREREKARREIARAAHDDLGDIPVNGFAGSTQRRSTIRATNSQDVYYYATRPAPQQQSVFGFLGAR